MKVISSNCSLPMQFQFMRCQQVLAIDSCHLNGLYKGALLSVIAYDADNGMFPLSLGVGGSENYED